MLVRRRAWLTREGWYFTTVLAFIIGGAALRSVNLLIVLAGIMIAMLIVNWRLVVASLTGLALRRIVPRQLLAGESVTIEVGIENSRWWMSSWLLVLEDRLEYRGTVSKQSAARETDRTAPPPAGEAPRTTTGRLLNGLIALGRTLVLPHGRRSSPHPEAIVAHVPAHGTATATYRLTLHRRGRYHFGPLSVSTRFPLGLVRGQMVVPEHHDVIVIPRIGRLLPAWTNLLEAELIGDHRRHPHRGIVEGDYYGLRPWQSGDSLRWMHWRTTAKLGRPVVRQFERRRSRDIAVVLDPWLPAHPHPRDEGLVELAISLAATVIADVTNRGQSQLTLAIALPQPVCHSGPASGVFCDELLARLAEIVPAGDCPVARALALAMERGAAGARLIVISPRPPSTLAATPSLAAETPDDLVWIDTSSADLPSLFSLD